jgi:hypothetical protein
MPHCPVSEELERSVEEALRALINNTTQALEAFQQRRDADLLRLDKELENAVGTKERCIGALRQHKRDHGCS